MPKTLLLIAILSVGSLACREPQRQDVAENGFLHALECLQEQDAEAATAADACGRRVFHPGSSEYAAGWNAALDCARIKGGPVAEAIEECGSGA